MSPSTRLSMALAATCTLFFTSAFAQNNTSSPYTLIADISGLSFFSHFTTFTSADPTHGKVDYLAMPSAASQSLLGYISDTTTNSTRAYIGVDHTTPNTPNRASVRLTSTQTFSVGMVAVFDLYHVPVSPGTWPALWFLGDVSPTGVWPGNGGEIDVVEFVNGGKGGNAMTLHTAPGCTVDNSTTTFSGILGESDCNAGNGDTGCSVVASNPANSAAGGQQGLATSGAAFNAQGGGVYVLSWTSSGVSVYLFPRDALPNDLSISPSSSTTLSSAPDPSTWTNATPLAHFSGSGCDFTTSLSTMQLIEDITFCGDWAGKVWSSMGLEKETGVATCEQWVAQNPQGLREAYWEIGSIRIWGQGAAGSSTATKREVRDGKEADGVQFPTIRVRDRYETEVVGMGSAGVKANVTSEAVPCETHQHHHQRGHGYGHRAEQVGAAIAPHRHRDVASSGETPYPMYTTFGRKARAVSEALDGGVDGVDLLMPRSTSGAGSSNGLSDSAAFWMAAAGFMVVLAALL